MLFFFSSKSISERFKAQIRESKKSGESEISFFTRAFRCVLSDLAWPWLEMMRGKAVFQSASFAKPRNPLQMMTYRWK